jgi:hypothetical protein
MSHSLMTASMIAFILIKNSITILSKLSLAIMSVYIQHKDTHPCNTNHNNIEHYNIILTCITTLCIMILSRMKIIKVTLSIKTFRTAVKLLVYG